MRWLPVLLICGTVPVAGCDARPRDLRWEIVFGDPTLRDRSASIEASIVRGDCESADAVFEAVFAPSEVGPTPPRLPPDQYSFVAVARDDACVSIAAGCSTARLPLMDNGEVVTPMLPAPLSEGCAAGEVCRSGGCVPGPEPDASTDAVMDTTVDTGPGSCDPETDPRCRLVPSNVDPSLFDPDAFDFTTSGDLLIDTTTCGIDFFELRPAPQLGGGSEVCVMTAGTLTVNAGDTVRAVGNRPLVILAEGAVVIDGTIDLSARRDEPGAGGGAPGSVDAGADGLSPGQPGLENGAASGGGGGGGLCGAGGDGGNGGLGATGGAGGEALVGWLLSPLDGGSGGGAGAAFKSLTIGGAGGGALQIASQTSIALSGVIVAGGGGGAGGVNRSAGGGGGSGGAVLLEAPTIDLTGRIGVSGGGGGGSGDDTGNGGAGENGGLNDARRGSFGGGAFSAFGGRGSTQTVLRGDPGESDDDTNGNGGGGGGGAGCILFRTFAGAVPGPVDGFNPTEAPGVRATTADFVIP